MAFFCLTLSGFASSPNLMATSFIFFSAQRQSENTSPLHFYFHDRTVKFGMGFPGGGRGSAAFIVVSLSVTSITS